MSNHVSFLDLFYHAWSNNFSFVSKKELLNAPIIGRIARINQCIFVDRENREDKDQVQDAISQRGQLMLEGKRFPSILIFPEGTCTNGQYLLSFKKGAFKPLLPVKIVCLEYPIRNFNVSLGVIDDFYTLLISLCQLKNNLKIYEFNTFYPDCLQLSRSDEDSWSVYSNRIKEIMLKAIPNVQNSESGYRDLIEYTDIIKGSVNQCENVQEKINIIGDDSFEKI